MKRNLLARLAPVAVFAVAITGAITTNAMEKNASKAAPVPGYQLISGSCVYKNDCENTERDFMCTVGNVDGAPQIYGKHPLTGQCNVPLWRP